MNHYKISLMKNKRSHFHGIAVTTAENLPRSRRQFFGFFRRREARNNAPRPGAIPPAMVKRIIDEIGVGGVAEILRIGFDGQIDDLPIVIALTNISKSGFAGKVISVEREFIEGNTQKKVFAKRGGGIIEFKFDDGDIRELKENADYQELA